jgi:hypothetical protein
MLTRMLRRLLLFLVLLPLALRADDEAGWSKSVDGLRARLVIPSHQNRGLDPEVRVYLEIQNSLDVLGNRKIFYTPDSLSLVITDEAGQPPPPATPPAPDGMESTERWLEPLIMPFDSTLRFRINLHTASTAGNPRLLLNLPGALAIIPASNTHTYFISGTFVIKHQKDNPVMAWQGTLELPKIPVPAE